MKGENKKEQDLMKMKRSLEHSINALCNDFERETGLSVNEIIMERAEIAEMENSVYVQIKVVLKN
jgi:hypothetical protein